MDIITKLVKIDKNIDYVVAEAAQLIKDGEIVIYWVSDGGDTKSLYWAGSYIAPTDNAEPYTWNSENDKEKTGSALLASGDDTKVFTYEKGEITYKASALGTTKKMHFVRTDTNYCDEEEEQK